jgi:transketolase
MIKANMRKAFGQGLVKAGQLDERVVALTADLKDSVGFGEFAEKFAQRFVDVGIAEQNLVTVASGMAHVGKIPFVGSYAVFSPGRNWEQIRTTICINNQPVKIVGSHAGVNVGPDGATHQALEDIALMRVLPNMVVLAPTDAVEAEQMAVAVAKDKRPNYVRLPRGDSLLIFDDNHRFEIGKIYRLCQGSDVVIFATGTMTAQALEASKILASKGIEATVLHVPTIKPLDEKAILGAVKKCRKVVTVEEHQIAGGFGSAIMEILFDLARPDLARPGLAKSGDDKAIKFHRVGVNDQFGQSGTAAELLEHYGLTAENIVKVAKEFIK